MLTCSSIDNIKSLVGWETITFCIKDGYVWNIDTSNVYFTALIITTLIKQEDDSLNTLITSYNNIVKDLQSLNTNKRYKIDPEFFEEYLYSEFFYISPHKPDSWYLN